MKLLVVLSALVVVCSARPEPPFSGYPSASGGFPPSGGPSFGSFGSSGGGPPSSFYGAPSGPGGIGGPNGGPGGDAAPTIHKHVYVHVPPPEQEPPRPKKVYPPRIPQKHYKIVFIKAPTPPTPTAPELPPVVQDEQKTLIYVLVKRPEEEPEIKIPTPAPTKPSKPEVYFIRYKTQKSEAEGGQAGYPAAGAPSGAAFPTGNGGSYSGPISGSSAPSNSYGPPSGGSY